jgi:hypothetical protein
MSDESSSNPVSQDNDEVVCSTVDCGFNFGDAPAALGELRHACPRCGGRSREIRKALSAELNPRGSLGYGAFPVGTTSKRRRFAWGFTGWDFSFSLKRLVRKDSVFDKRADRRYEHVEDPETGEVLHHEDHPLSEHWGHGSAKLKPQGAGPRSSPVEKDRP